MVWDVCVCVCMKVVGRWVCLRWVCDVYRVCGMVMLGVIYIVLAHHALLCRAADSNDGSTCSALIPPLMGSNVVVAKASFSRVLRGAVYLVSPHE